jgi:hypothetical protein
MLKSVNRNCLIVTPIQGYIDWARSMPDATPDLRVVDPEEPGHAYLIPEQDSGPDKWLKRNYQAIFEEELEAWCLDADLWPKGRSYKAFQAFFEVRFFSMVMDLGKGLLEVEEDEDE